MILHIGRVLRFGSVLSLSLLAAGWSVPAHAQVKLEHKFVEGAKQVAHTTIKLKQIATINGSNSDAEIDRFVISSSEVVKPDDQGNVRVEHKTDKFSATTKLPGGTTLTFDSDDPNRKADNPMLEPLMDVFRAVAKSRTTTVHDKSGKILRIEGLDKTAEGLPDALKGEFDADKAKKAANRELEIIPSEPIKVGETWKRDSEIGLGGGQLMKFSSEYKYVGEVKEGDKTLHKIESKTLSVVYTREDNPNVRVSKSELSPKESGGVILFDAQAGQVRSMKSKVQIVGNFELSAGGMALPGKLDLTLESETVRQP